MVSQTATSPGQARHASTSQAVAREPGTLAVSVVILTLNEEINIRACIESCADALDIHVLDSGSTDQTRAIAESLGARVWVNPFKSFGAQRNWAIDNITVQTPWIFHLDADERFTPELVQTLRALLAKNPDEAGFHVPNKMMFMGRWLKRSGAYPTYQMRLFHKDRMRFSDYGHGQREDTTGRVGRIETPYLHYSFSKGLFDWFDKHNRYSSQEAIQFINREESLPALSDLLARNPTQRRRAWKRVLYGFPGWPIINLCARLFVFGGILEGKAGVTYCTMLAMYEQQIRVKLRLLRHAHKHGTTFESDGMPTAPPLSPAVVVPDAATIVPQSTPTIALTPIAHPSLSVPQRTDSVDILPEKSPWTTREKIGRALWMLVGSKVFRLTFHNWYGVRRGLLRLFGATVEKGVRIRPTAHVEVPWNCTFKEGSVVGDRAIIYSLGTITIGRYAVISQYAHLCAGTHDFTDKRFTLIRDPIVIGDGAWISADSFVGPNVTVGDRAILGARASAYKDLEPDTIYAGNPAKNIRRRNLKDLHHGGARDGE